MIVTNVTTMKLANLSILVLDRLERVCWSWFVLGVAEIILVSSWIKTNPIIYIRSNQMSPCKLILSSVDGIVSIRSWVQLVVPQFTGATGEF